MAKINAEIPESLNRVLDKEVARNKTDASSIITAASETLKQLHQTMEAVSICKPVTKFSATVASSDTLSEARESTFSEASSTQIRAMKKMHSIRWIEAILDIALLAGFISAMGFLVRLAF